MRQFRFGIPIAGVLAMIFGLSGCADENPWGNSTQEKGSISLTLSTDSGIKTAKPVFRSEEEDNAPDPNNLNTYFKVPAPEEFSIHLEKTDESFSKTWTSLQSFINYTKENFFDAGAYTMTAFYGEKGKQDFTSPYFEATTSFNVLSDQVQEVNLVAELKNSMIKINYTDNFKDYMSDYHSRIRTEGRVDEIILNKDQSGVAFIEPNNASLTVHFTTKGKGYQSSVNLGEFPPLAKTLHNITMDIVENSNGNASLELSFDETLKEENVYIDLTEELLTTPSPEITCIGFSDGEFLDMLEGSSSISEVRMDVKSYNKIKSAILTVESTNYRPGWGNEIDLCLATEEQKQLINAAGISAIGFGFIRSTETDEYASLDLTQFGKSLPIGTHKVALIVTDIDDKVSAPVSVSFDSQPIEIEVINIPSISYISDTATVTIDYNGINPTTDVKFVSSAPLGEQFDLEILACEEETATRGFEKKRYTYTIGLPQSVSTAKQFINIKIYHNGSSLKAEGQIPVIIPDYNLEFDAFSQYALVRVTTPGTNDPKVLTTILENISIKLNGDMKELVRDYDRNIIGIGNLTPGTDYSVTSTITCGDIWDENKGTFKSETELSIVNGDFTDYGKEINITDLQVGGKYNVAPVDYTIKSSIKRTEPANWATVNSLTAWEGSTNKNTWFIVPSSWNDNGVGYMRNVGYHHDGTTPAKSGGAFNIKYYCENAPSNEQLDKAAGELFLGTYEFNGSAHRDNGIPFASRPSAITFDYDYSPIDSDLGEAYVKVLDANNNVLAEETFYIPEGKSTKTMNLHYNPFEPNAARLMLGFKSSKQGENAPIHIPLGKELNENQSLGNQTIAANSYHAVATGSELRIDNVKIIYGNSETTATTPKKNSKKKK